MKNYNRYLILSLVLCLITVIMCAYWPLRDNDLVSYDDEKYLTENVYVKNGLTMDGIKWAFVAFYHSNWIPLTWISYMIDTELYDGVNPRGVHMTNLLLHVLSTVLLFYLLTYMTKSPKAAGMVSALFAIHPLNVESVAWAAERKSVLSMLFWFLTMLAYCYYVARPSIRRYLTVMLSLALGLLSKPLLVTLPVVLLLMDYWPLNRLGEGTSVKEWRGQLLRLSFEKVPLLVLSVLSSIMVIAAQKRAESIFPLSVTPLKFRILSAVLSYANYIEKTLWPSDLAVFYPYVEINMSWLQWLRVLSIAGMTVFAFMQRHKRPSILVGWLWYLITMLPMIQIIQVSIAPMADRYAYAPTLGIFILITWSVAEAASKASRLFRSSLVVVSTMIILSLSVLTFRQVQYWRDSGTLFKHALEVTKNNYVAYNNYGTYLLNTGRVQEAIDQFSEGLKIMPDYPLLNYNMWGVLLSQGRYEEASRYFLKATSFMTKGGNPYFYKMLSQSFMKQMLYDEALKYAQKALDSQPTDVEALQYASQALSALGRYEEALPYFSRSIKVNPDNWQLHYNKGLALKKLGKYDEALVCFRQALSLNPSSETIKNVIHSISNSKE